MLAAVALVVLLFTIFLIVKQSGKQVKKVKTICTKKLYIIYLKGPEFDTFIERVCYHA